MNSGCSAPTHSGAQVSACFATSSCIHTSRGARKRDLAARALVDDDTADRLAAAESQRFVDDRLQRKVLAAADLLVSGDHGDWHRRR